MIPNQGNKSHAMALSAASASASALKKLNEWKNKLLKHKVQVIKSIQSLILYVILPIFIIAEVLLLRSVSNTKYRNKERESEITSMSRNIHKLKNEYGQLAGNVSWTDTSILGACDSMDQNTFYDDKHKVSKNYTKSLFHDFTANRHLTHAQCDLLFPELFLEIDRSWRYWGQRGGISKELIDVTQESGNARVLIYKGRLYVNWYSKQQINTRTMAILHSINEAIVGSIEPIPNLEFIVQTSDTTTDVGVPWTLSRRENMERPVLMPDFGFWSWPEPGVGSFADVQENCTVLETSQSWSSKFPKLFFKGALMTDFRKDLIKRFAKYSWSSMSDIDWSHANTSLVTPEDHCKYQYLAHLEGHAYSGRLKYLLQCRSVSIMHQLNYVQHFHHLLNGDPKSPKQNVVILDSNMDELPNTMNHFLSHPEDAERIANVSFNYWRHYLSPPSIDCYWRRLFSMWGSLLTYDPELDLDSRSWQSFSLLEQIHWDVY